MTENVFSLMITDIVKAVLPEIVQEAVEHEVQRHMARMRLETKNYGEAEIRQMIKQAVHGGVWVKVGYQEKEVMYVSTDASMAVGTQSRDHPRER